MIQTIFLLELLASIISFYSKNRYRDTYNISKVLLYTALIITACNLFVAHISSIMTFHVINFAGVHLQLMFQFDYLACVMLTVVLSISLIIYQYAERYLESDVTRPRFLAQLCLITLSVSILVLSGNLLTAFIGWQFIGISLYITLNHYHFDTNANRASKKKFVINRWGDMCFLAAVILCYQYLGDSTYTTLYHHSHTGLIGLLVFMAIMTKSAQFPCHIWLPDTMEAPTPVSALMHAGVINSGGFLLTRLAPLYVTHKSLMYLISAVGLVTALAGSLFMLYQYDVKKRLAYSTMGQMGYMILQCGLGAFASAIFHLIAHGFYKASLFLNAGDTLTSHSNSSQQLPIRLLGSLSLSVLLMLAGLVYAHIIDLHLPILIWFFIASTVLALMKANLTSRYTMSVKCLNASITVLILVIYLTMLAAFTHFLPVMRVTYSLSPLLQYGLGSLIILVQLVFGFVRRDQFDKNRHLKLLLVNKCYIETVLRYGFLNPLRQAGDIINSYFQHIKPWSYGVLLFVLLVLASGLWFIAASSLVLMNLGMVVVLSIMLVTITAANRGTRLQRILLWLGLFELALINLAFMSDGAAVTEVGIYHLINMGALFIMATFLIHYTTTMPNRSLKYLNNNQLGWRKAYVATMLILMLGIPGTGSFITEYYIFNSLITSHALYALWFGLIMIVLSISILHCLQLYIFDQNPLYNNPSPLPPMMHIASWSVIGLNVVSGIQPMWLLYWL